MCVCACACFAWPGRAGRPPGRVLVRLTFSFGRFVFLLCLAPSGLGLPPSLSLLLPFPVALALCLVVFLGLPLPGSPCARASFVSPAWPLAALWWLLPPPSPFVSRGFRRSCLVPWCFSLFFFLFLLPLCALVVSGFLWFPAPGALGLGAVRCLLCWPSASRLSVRLSLFRAFRLAVGCSLVVAAPPPPPPPLCVSRFASLPLGAVCRVLCCAVCPWVQCCAALLRVVSPGVVLLCAVLHSFNAAACCAVPSGAALRPRALCSAALCFAVFPRAVCSLLGVFCRGAVVRAVVRRSALCCVCPGMLCCAFPVFSALCGAVLRCAGALALCCSFGACCCWRLVLWCAAVRVLLFPVVCRGAVLCLVARGCLLVACFGVGVPVWPRGLLPGGWCGLLWCPAFLCRVLWCCAVVGASCCGVSLCVVVSRWAFCGVVVLLWCPGSTSQARKVLSPLGFWEHRTPRLSDNENGYRANSVRENPRPPADSPLGGQCRCADRCNRAVASRPATS